MGEFYPLSFLLFFGFTLVLCDLSLPAGATNPDELSFGLRVYPPVAVLF